MVTEMQTNNEYRELMDEARKKHLANIQMVSRKIAKLYNEAAMDLAKRAKKYRQGTLSERWATEYTYQLRKRSLELYNDLYDVTLQGLKRSASYPTTAANNFFSMIGGQSFVDTFASTPDLVIAEILSGEIYKDKRGLSARIWGTTKGLENDVDYIVNRAIAEHKSAVGLAADLEEYVQTPAKRSWDWGRVYTNLRGKKVDYNAQRLARTCINHSYWLSNVKTCEHNPFVTAMHWELSMSHEERQIIPFGRDCCDDYAEHDEGLGIGNFPVSSLPLPHPQCLCVQWAVIPESLENIGDEIGRWMSGETNSKLDNWYQKEYGEELNSSEKGIIIHNGKGSGKKSNSGSSNIQRVHSIGHIDINDTQAVEDIMRKFDSHYTSKPIEYACVIDRYGKVYIARGGELGVDTSVMLGNRMRGSISVHNHPPGTSQYSFSLDEDFGSFSESGEHIMRAYDELYGYEIVRSENMPTWEDFNRFYSDNRYNYSALSQYGLDMDNYETQYIHALTSFTCDHFGVNYRRWSNDKR